MAFARFCFCKNNKRTIIIRGKWGSEGFEESPEFYNVCVKKGDTFLCPLLCVFLEEGGRGVSQ